MEHTHRKGVITVCFSNAVTFQSTFIAILLFKLHSKLLQHIIQKTAGERGIFKTLQNKAIILSKKNLERTCKYKALILLNYLCFHRVQCSKLLKILFP